jgi:hypothetical protein
MRRVLRDAMQCATGHSATRGNDTEPSHTDQSLLRIMTGYHRPGFDSGAIHDIAPSPHQAHASGRIAILPLTCWFAVRAIAAAASGKNGNIGFTWRSPWTISHRPLDAGDASPISMN